MCEFQAVTGSWTFTECLDQTWFHSSQPCISTIICFRFAPHMFLTCHVFPFSQTVYPTVEIVTWFLSIFDGGGGIDNACTSCAVHEVSHYYGQVVLLASFRQGTLAMSVIIMTRRHDDDRY